MTQNIAKLDCRQHSVHGTPVDTLCSGGQTQIHKGRPHSGNVGFVPTLRHSFLGTEWSWKGAACNLAGDGCQDLFIFNPKTLENIYFIFPWKEKINILTFLLSYFCYLYPVSLWSSTWSIWYILAHLFGMQGK